jgi:hypothetical protein
LSVGYFVLASSLESSVRAVRVFAADPGVVVVCDERQDGFFFNWEHPYKWWGIYQLIDAKAEANQALSFHTNWPAP